MCWVHLSLVHLHLLDALLRCKIRQFHFRTITVFILDVPNFYNFTFFYLILVTTAQALIVGIEDGTMVTINEDSVTSVPAGTTVSKD